MIEGREGETGARRRLEYKGWDKHVCSVHSAVRCVVFIVQCDPAVSSEKCALGAVHK